MAEMYKTKADIKSLEEIVEAIKGKLGDKYQITISRADKGAKKFLTGNTADMIRIKKNGYHGVVISFSEGGESYATMISVGGWTPSSIIEMITRKAGLLDKLIFNAIWGSGKQFYGDIDKAIKESYNAIEVNMGVGASIKRLVKGENIASMDGLTDEAKDKLANEIEDAKENL